MNQNGWGSRDAPWWYNERASLSLLAGAVWYADGWAFEEFVTVKRPGARKRPHHGRGDLMFEIRNHRFVTEAKQCWPTIGSKPDRAVAIIDKALSRACEAADQNRIRTYRAIGLVFVVPYFTSRSVQERERRIRTLLRCLRLRRSLTLAWAFPGDQRLLRSEKGRYYPGVILIATAVR